MKKWFPAMLCLMLLFTQGAGAEETTAGAYARTIEADAKAAGMEVRRETTLTWGGLPLLDEETNAALESLLKAFRLDTFAQGDDDMGYVGFEARLSNAPVADLTMHAQGGIYYEQSNLLGGQTVAFTRDDFAAFARRLSERSDGVMPQALDWLFELTMLAVGGTGNLQLEAGMLDKAIASYDQWQVDALQPEERVRPTVYIPGLYGTRATVIEVTREEALSLVDAVGALLAGEDALLLEAARMQSPQADEAQLRQIVSRIDKTLYTLPETLEKALPETLAPSEYREVYGPDGALVVRQLEVCLPEDASILMEWVPEGTGMPALYASIKAGEGLATLLLTQEIGVPRTIGRVTRVRDSMIAEFILEDSGLRADMIMTRTETYERQGDKETVTAKTDWMIESAALLGEGAVVTVTAKESGTASGEGTGYVNKHETAWTVKGLGFDNRTLLTVATQTKLQDAASPIVPDGELLVYPAQLDDEAFDAWLKDVQVSFVQAGHTILGRLPKVAAAYVLERME